MHCLMGKVWSNFEQNQTEAIKIIEQNQQSMYYQSYCKNYKVA